jgi:hypothetical protein
VGGTGWVIQDDIQNIIKDVEPRGSRVSRRDTGWVIQDDTGGWYRMGDTG